MKRSLLIITIPASFTLLVAWFAWSALRAAPHLAAENLRGAALSISAAIEQLADADPSFRTLRKYTTPDIAYFALIDDKGILRFHTNSRLIGRPSDGLHRALPEGVAEQRQRLGTGEEVYLLPARVHTGHAAYRLVLALHTYRADKVIRRARTGIAILVLLTAVLWGLTVLVLNLLRRQERHRKEMQRREELARLGEMGAMMAHEIRNPLAGIKGFAQLAGAATDLQQAQRHAEKVVVQSVRLEALVGDLLAFAREDQGERELADLAQVVEDCAAIMRLEAATQNVEIEVIAPGPLQVSICVDRIVQMLMNLMKNAIQAMPAGGVLSIGVKPEKNSVCLWVRDNGLGIPQENMHRIFEPFWTSRAQGTGLGLALSRKVAEDHGGFVTVESKVGSGTLFMVTLPVAA